MPTIELAEGALWVEVGPEKTRYDFRLRELGGRWIPRRNQYKFGRLLLNVALLEERIPGIRLSPEVEEMVAHPWGFPRVDRGQAKHPRWADLYDHQRETVDYLLSSPLPGAFLGLSPRLGKTVTTLIASEVLKAQNVLIIAAGESHLESWKAEARKWTQHEVEDRHLQGPVPGWNVTTAETIIPRMRKGKRTTNSAARFLEYTRMKWDIVILDESVGIKNKATARFKNLKKLRARTRRWWNLSGSPATRNKADLWPQLNTIYPQAFASYWRFVERYCEVEETVWSRVIHGDKDGMDLRNDLRDVMFIRHRREVTDMPDREYIHVRLPLLEEQASIYEDLTTDFVTQLASGRVVTVDNKMAQMVRLAQVVSCPANIGGSAESSKIDWIVQKVDADGLETPILFWVHWRKTADALHKALESRLKVAVVNGETQDNSGTIATFKAGGLDALVISPGVGKFGHTLANARTVVYVDFTFNMDAHIQSLARTELLGQKEAALTYVLACPGTIDTYILQNLQGKAPSVASITNADLVGILQSLGDVQIEEFAHVAQG